MNLAFRRYERVVLDGATYEIDRRTDTGFLLINLSDRLPKEASAEQLARAFDEGRLSRAISQALPGPQQDFAALPDTARIIAISRRKLVDAIINTLGPPPYSDALLERELPAISEATGLRVDLGLRPADYSAAPKSAP